MARGNEPPDRESVPRQEPALTSRSLKAELRRIGKYAAVGLIVLAVPFFPWAIAGLFMSLPAMTGIVTGHFHVADTRAAGHVTRLVHHGVIWRSWEATLAVTQNGSLADRSTWLSYSDPLYFSIASRDPDAELKADVLMDALRSGAHVRVSLTERSGVLPWLGTTGIYLDRIDVSPLPRGGNR